tara:strand:+ start:176 stop:511 length:336 start_codon:yes stop_codon:yes gene_type:complete
MRELKGRISNMEETQTKKVNLELEIDTNTIDSSKNKHQNLIDLAKAIDAWRIFPRMFLTVYIVLLYQVVHWFMEIDSPNLEQSGLVSVVVGAGAAWFGLYAGTSKNKINGR